MSDFGIKPVGQVIAKDETETLEWQVKNLLPLIDDALSTIAEDPFMRGWREAVTNLRHLSISRFVDNHKTYGNALFKMTDKDLKQAYNEEIADAIVYRAEMMRRGL